MNFNFPDYCNFHKFLLVEEIALADNPALIHYGKCTIIGILASSELIQSISIPNVQREYQLPDGAVGLRIHTEKHLSVYVNSTVQIYGEVRLHDHTLSVKNFESAQSLMQKLREAQRRFESQLGLKEREPSGTSDSEINIEVKVKLEEEINAMKEKYRPIIQVLDIKHQPQARQIIVENLYYRKIRISKNRSRRIS